MNILENRSQITFLLLIITALTFFAPSVFAADYGDVNNSGRIDIVDALLVAQYCAGLQPVFDISLADVDRNNTVTIVDALLIAQYSALIITQFPTPKPTPTTTPSLTPTPTPTPTVMLEGDITGYIYDESTKLPVKGAIIRGTANQSITDASGYYRINYKYTTSRPTAINVIAGANGYAMRLALVTLPDTGDALADIYLIPNTPPSPEPRLSVIPVGTHLNNPFVAAKWYVNPDWSAKATAGNGARIANYNTAIWLDSVASITAGRGLQGHLDEALAQGANLITLVLYDLPNRSCQSPGYSPEFTVSADGLNRYKSEFIDPISNILTDPKYSSLCIVCIVEPESVSAILGSPRAQACDEAMASGTYTASIQYVLNKLSPNPNIYLYLDIVYSAWLGWADNYPHVVDFIINCIKNTNMGMNSIAGFVTNVAEYVPFEEPFLTNPEFLVGGQPIKTSKFFDYNICLDEFDYAILMYDAFVKKGFPADVGMLIDTSRNGWGGPNRPTAVSTSTDINIFVNQSRIDRRFHRSNYCNNKYAGLGPRPQFAPAKHIDAFVWIKNPGESDGSSVPLPPDPSNPLIKFDKMCDPGAGNYYCSCGYTDALSNSPYRGSWSQPQFDQLLRNAYPPIEP